MWSGHLIFRDPLSESVVLLKFYRSYSSVPTFRMGVRYKRVGVRVHAGCRPPRVVFFVLPPPLNRLHKVIFPPTSNLKSFNFVFGSFIVKRPQVSFQFSTLGLLI